MKGTRTIIVLSVISEERQLVYLFANSKTSRSRMFLFFRCKTSFCPYIYIEIVPLLLNEVVILSTLKCESKTLRLK